MSRRRTFPSRLGRAERDAELKEFYHQLWVSEARHGNIFVKMALNYFAKDNVYSRLQELNEAEGK